jgi:23S rRNA pseudouridine2605 synthase
MNDGPRLNKYISHNSKYSRREADQLIKDGKVVIKGKVITDLSTRIGKGDKVYINNRFMHPRQEFTVIVYNKLKGELVTKKDDRGRKTIYDNLSKRYHHYIPVGRLDYASEGLILLTDAPDVATTLMTSKLERIYYLKIKGQVTDSMIAGMKEGLKAEFAMKGGHEKSEIVSMDFAPFNWFKVQKNDPNFSKLKVSISEGKNRELRRFFAYYGSEVMDLKRVEFGGISLDIRPGKMRYLEKIEYHSLHTFLQSLKISKKRENRQQDE